MIEDYMTDDLKEVMVEMLDTFTKKVKVYNRKIDILYILCIINFICMVFSLIFDLLPEIFNIGFLILLIYYIYICVKFNKYINDMKIAIDRISKELNGGN